MTNRQRLLAALRHQESDRVPIDLGSTESSGMTAVAYHNLKRHLGLPQGCRVFEPYQHVAFIEEEIRDHFDLAAYPVIFEPRRWRAGALPGGGACELPEGWHTRSLPDGSEEALDAAGRVIGRRAASGYHFDPTNPPLAEVETKADLAKHRSAIARFDWPEFADEEPEQLASRARGLRRESDRAAVLNFQAHLLAAGQILRGFATALMLFW